MKTIKRNTYFPFAIVLLTVSIHIFAIKYEASSPCLKNISQKKHLYSNNEFFQKKTIQLNKTLKLCETKETHFSAYHEKAAKNDLISEFTIKKMTNKYRNPVIGIMGRGSIKRSSLQYKNAALIGKTLAEKKYMIVTGGGPGVMEAVHLGVWFAGRDLTELNSALEVLANHSDTQALSYFESVKNIKRKYPRVMKTFDLSVLTYVYGTKLANGFAHNYTTFFNNAIREETITIAAKDGIIFLPGGNGTKIELFLSLEYNTDAIETNPSRPIILFNSHFWGSVFSNQFLDNIILTNDIKEIPTLLEKNTPN